MSFKDNNVWFINKYVHNGSKVWKVCLKSIKINAFCFEWENDDYFIIKLVVCMPVAYAHAIL